MELYYKDLISEDASLDELVDDLMCIVQGADELVEATGAGIDQGRLAEIASRLAWLKRGLRQLQTRARASAQATDRLLHRYPYSAAGFALGLGLAAGILFRRRGR
jgi:ElaB/YqjD/DUF883 family membrane-anchored ribosome-binding protein